MTDFTFDRSFYTEGTSSVIDEVFYNSETKQLLVELARRSWDGSIVRAGYEDVPADVFTAMEALNTNRVENDDESASVGSYWNAWVKPFFKGFDTAGLEPVSAKQPDLVAQAPVEDISTSQVVNTGSISSISTDGTGYFTVLSAPAANQSQFTVHFVDGDEEDHQLTLTAADQNDALTRFNQIAVLAQWNLIEIQAITQYFD